MLGVSGNPCTRTASGSDRVLDVAECTRAIRSPSERITAICSNVNAKHFTSDAVYVNLACMAGIALVQRDLAATRQQLRGVVRAQVRQKTAVSELRAANKAAGWSSESLVFAGEVCGMPTTTSSGSRRRAADLPGLRLGTQTRTQNLLHGTGLQLRHRSATSLTNRGSARGFW